MSHRLVIEQTIQICLRKVTKQYRLHCKSKSRGARGINIILQPFINHNRRLKPTHVAVRDGSLLNMLVTASSGSDGGGQRRGAAAGAGVDVVALQKQVESLRAQLKEQNAVAGAPTTVKSGGKRVRPKTCFVCGSTEHLRAQCPHPDHRGEVKQFEEWLAVLEGESCLLPAEIRQRQVHETRDRIAALRREVDAARDKAVLPEQLLAARRADVKKCAEALAAARGQLEQHEILKAKMEDEETRLREDVDVEAMAFRQAEAALEEAQHRVATTMGAPAASAPMEAPPAPRAPALSPQGATALEGLSVQLSQLAWPCHIQKAEEEYKQVIAMAGPVEEPPSLIAYVLKRLSDEGMRQLDLVKFDLSKEVRSSFAAPSQPAAAPPPLPAPGPLVAPQRPRTEGGLGDDARMPVRQTPKMLPSAKAGGASVMGGAMRDQARADRMAELAAGNTVADEPVAMSVPVASAAAEEAQAAEDSGPANAEDALARAGAAWVA